MDVEWHEAKRRSNIDKHGIDFVDAIRVFGDPGCRIYRSNVQTGEDREVAVGRINGRCIAVVFVRRGDVVRIISARIARKSERQAYEQDQERQG
ncbi:MAG: BrnT family toxin [Bauldia sp.]|nr:BrnT family toxin [Bauldia sp.]